MANYNPYKAAESIVKSKAQYDEAKATGKDVSPYENQAKQYYEELRNNGRNDIADTMQKSGFSAAADYLKTLKNDYGFSADRQGTQNKSNDAYKTIRSNNEDLKTASDKVYDNNINVNPLQKDYGTAIISGFGGAANEAYGKALRSGVSDNSGNADSFAAANANRQKTAMVSQGYDMALKYYDAIANQANNWYANRANALSGAASQLQNNVDADRNYIYQDDKRKDDTALNRYLGELGYLGQLDTNDANKYVSDNDYAGKVEAAQIAGDADKYVADQKLTGDVYTSDNNLRGTMYKSDNDLTGTKYAANASITRQQVANQGAKDVAKINGQYGVEKAKYSGSKKSGTSSGTGSSSDGLIDTKVPISGMTAENYFKGLVAANTDPTVKVLDTDGLKETVQEFTSNPNYTYEQRQALANLYFQKTGLNDISVPSDGYKQLTPATLDNKTSVLYDKYRRGEYGGTERIKEDILYRVQSKDLTEQQARSLGAQFGIYFDYE